MQQPEATQGDISWFTQARFGMFIHWGLYSLPARHEWVQSRELIAPEVYRKYFEVFNPTDYNPDQWADAALAAGMKYVVLTSKHHEGFCLWDSAYTDYKITNTPYGKDLLTPFVEAFRSRGLKVGFYYSLIDWHHPHFPIDVFHPLRDQPDAAQLNESRDMTLYAEYLKRQVVELLTHFGQIDILWLDFSYPGRDYHGLPGKGRADWKSDDVYAAVRELQPHILVNNRLDLPYGYPDFYTPEQFQPREWVQVDGKPVNWETCQTFSGSWGYHRDETSWKSPGQLIRMLVNTVATGGNLLMNVGPTSRGTFDQRAYDALRVYGDWLAAHGEAIYGCTQSDFVAPPDTRLTQNGNRLYVHVFAWPFKHLHLDGLAGKVKFVRLLHDGSEVLFRENGDTLTLELPVQEPDVTVPVLRLDLY